MIGNSGVMPMPEKRQGGITKADAKRYMREYHLEQKQQAGTLSPEEKKELAQIKIIGAAERIGDFFQSTSRPIS